jgi:hypothetical protein
MPVVNGDEGAKEEREDEFPKEGEYAGGDQYDPEEVFVLEDLEEDPNDDDEAIWMGAMRIIDEEIHLGVMTHIQDSEASDVVFLNGEVETDVIR